MKRSIFYHKLTVDGVNELDFLWNSLSSFVNECEYETTYYRVDSSDLPDPALISFKCYGTPDFWWLIMLFNGVENPLTELAEGILLEIPSRLDIYNFQKKYRVRRT